MKNRIVTIICATLLFVIPCLTYSCTTAQSETEEKQELPTTPTSNSNTDIVLGSTAQQDAAFTALNSIQVKGDNLYSTFVGLNHDCFPPDTSFVVSQDELRVALKALLVRSYTDIPNEVQVELSNEAVLAQKEYVVLRCKGNALGERNDVNIKTPTTGWWVLPKVLGERDVVIKWF